MIPEKVLKHMNYGITTTILDEYFIKVHPLTKPKEKEIKMPIVDKKVYLLNCDTFKMVGRFTALAEADTVGRKAKYKYLCLENEKSLDQIPLKPLNLLRKNLGLSPQKKKETALKGVWKVIESLPLKAPAKPAKEGKKKEKKKRGPSRYEKIMELFKKYKGKITQDHIKDFLKIKNPQACMASLANPKKTKKPIIYTYDKEKKVFILGGHAADKIKK